MSAGGKGVTFDETETMQDMRRSRSASLGLDDAEDRRAWLECLRAAAVLMSSGRHPHALTPSMLADVLFQDYCQRCR